jgi:hypothetical protein
LTNSAIAGISAGSISGALIVAVAGLFLIRRYSSKKKAAAAREQVFPEEAYLYDPPMPQVVMTHPASSSYPQIPPVRSITPWGSDGALGPPPAAAAPGQGRGSFESVDLAGPHNGYLGVPGEIGNTDSLGGVSAHDWATEGAHGPNPFIDPNHAITAGALGGAAVGGGAAAGYAATTYQRDNPYANEPLSPQDQSVSALGSSSSVHSVPSPIARVLEENGVLNGQTPRPLHPLEREAAMERQASMSNASSADDADQQEHSPLMERAVYPREELWMHDGYQRVVTHDVWFIPWPLRVRFVLSVPSFFPCVCVLWERSRAVHWIIFLDALRKPALHFVFGWLCCIARRSPDLLLRAKLWEKGVFLCMGACNGCGVLRSLFFRFWIVHILIPCHTLCT